MTDYRNFDQLRTTELTVLRHGFFKPRYELTDGQFCYGKLVQISIWRPAFLIEIAQDSWLIKSKSMFGTTFFIQQPASITIGSVKPELLIRKTKLTMDNGFNADFLTETRLSKNYIWINDEYGKILQIKQSLWSYKAPFKITIDLDLLKSIPPLPFLMFLGVNIILLKRTQAATSI